MTLSLMIILRTNIQPYDYYSGSREFSLDQLKGKQLSAKVVFP